MARYIRRNRNGYGNWDRDTHKEAPYPKSPRHFSPKYEFDRPCRENPKWRPLNSNELIIDEYNERWHEDLHISKKEKLMDTRRDVSYSVNAYDSSDIFAADSLRFINQLGERNNYSTRVKWKAEDSLDNILNTILSGLNTICAGFKIRYEYHGQNTVYIFVYDAAFTHVMVRIDDYNSSTKPYEVTDRDMTVIVQGLPDMVPSIAKHVDDTKVEVTKSRIEWKFMSGGRPQSKNMTIKDPPKPLDEFYPWLNDSIENYFDRFLASDSNILIFLGEPGAGKTSLIRHLIVSRDLNCTVTYDNELLKSDSLYVDYLLDDDMNMLIVEDAETILTDRKNAGNQIMSKLLNVSDGLVKVFNKKMIFTANVNEIDDIDSAILRPGRAFDIVKFRKLTFKEAVAAAKAAGIDPPTEHDDYSLAEVFKLKEAADAVRNVEKVQSFGFGFTSGR